MAPGLDLGDRGILSLLGFADRAKPIVPLIRRVLPMLRDRDPGTLPHLHLYAIQAGLILFADRVGALITNPPWSLRYTDWQRELVRGVIGHHAGAVNAIAVTLDDEGNLQAFTAGDDGVFRIWNLRTGSHRSVVGTSLEKADPRPVTAVAGGLGDAGTPIVVSGDSYGTVRAWDLTAGTAIGRPLRVLLRIAGLPSRRVPSRASPWYCAGPAVGSGSGISATAGRSGSPSPPAGCPRLTRSPQP